MQIMKYYNAIAYVEQIVAIDPDQGAFEVGLEFIKKAGVENKINFVKSDAISALNEMLNNVSMQ